MKIYQLRDMTTGDLNNSLNDSYEALENFQFQHASGQLENYKALMNTKRDIARILSVLKEREMGINKKSNKETEK